MLSIPENLPPPWWLLGGMLVVYMYNSRADRKMQAANANAMTAAFDRMMNHFIESGKQLAKAFERSLTKVCNTHASGLSGVEHRLGEVADKVGGLTQALEHHTERLDVINKRFGGDE